MSPTITNIPFSYPLSSVPTEPGIPPLQSDFQFQERFEDESATEFNLDRRISEFPDSMRMESARAIPAEVFSRCLNRVLCDFGNRAMLQIAGALSMRIPGYELQNRVARMDVLHGMRLKLEKLASVALEAGKFIEREKRNLGSHIISSRRAKTGKVTVTAPPDDMIPTLLSKFSRREIYRNMIQEGRELALAGQVVEMLVPLAAMEYLVSGVSGCAEKIIGQATGVALVVPKVWGMILPTYFLYMVPDQAA